MDISILLISGNNFLPVAEGNAGGEKRRAHRPKSGAHYRVTGL
jgi:hypothetical protein